MDFRLEWKDQIEEQEGCKQSGMTNSRFSCLKFPTESFERRLLLNYKVSNFANSHTSIHKLFFFKLFCNSFCLLSSFSVEKDY